MKKLPEAKRPDWNNARAVKLAAIAAWQEDQADQEYEFAMLPWDTVPDFEVLPVAAPPPRKPTRQPGERRGRKPKADSERHPATRGVDPSGVEASRQYEWIRWWLGRMYPDVNKGLRARRALEFAAEYNEVEESTIKNYRNRARSTGKR